LVEAAWGVVRQPGPLRAFYQRIRARRGHQVAVVAAARKLACLFWCMLTRGEAYAFQQPSLTKKKLRRLELTAGAPRYQGGRSVWSTNDAMRRAERDLALQAERAYQRTVADWHATTASQGASATPGRASQGRQAASSAAEHRSQTLRFSSSSPAPKRTLARSGSPVHTDLTFIRRAKHHVPIAPYRWSVVTHGVVRA
jgi:transposase